MKYTEQRIGSTTYKFQDFDSINEFNDYLNKAEVNRHFAGQGEQKSDDSDYTFRGTYNYKEASDLFATGWVAAAERITKKLPIQTAQQTTNRTKPTYGVVGGQASVPRYLQGIPTNMVDRKPVPQKQKIIVINRDITFNAMTRKEDIEREGIKALQLIQALENKGYRVKLNMFFLSNYGYEALAFRVCVKKPEERLSIIKVAFPLAHPSMLRRIGFRWMETHPKMQDSGFVYGYGRAEPTMIQNIVPKSEYLLPNFIQDVEKFVESMDKAIKTGR